MPEFDPEQEPTSGASGKARGRSAAGLSHGQERHVSDTKPPDNQAADPAPGELPHWLRGDPIAEHLRSLGRPVTKAAWLECAYGSSNEVVLEQDKETRAWIRSNFPLDPNEAVG